MPSIFDTAPAALRQLVVNTHNELSNLGVYTPEEVETMTMRFLQHAGWYQTVGGWKLLGPDVRDKVNIRKAEPQPDGNFLIRDVDVFYPNAVKGKTDDRVFTKEDIARAIVNTNTAIRAGSQKPALALEHPNPLRHLTGTPAKAFGSGINWRWSPRGDGWVRCDLVDVSPKVVADWRNHEWTGLSAGFANDADELNLRFGHIALLGVETQALSHLPITEVFSVENQLCFSTESHCFLHKDTCMDRKQAFSALRNAYSAMSSAYASAEAGEPNFEAKVTQAKSQFDAATKQFGAMGEMGGGAVGGELGGTAGTALGTAVGGPVGGAIGGAVGEGLGAGIGAEAGGQAQDNAGAGGVQVPPQPGFNASQEPQEVTWLPQAPQLPAKDGSPSQVIDTPTGTAGGSHFSAQEAQQMRQTITELQTVIGSLHRENVMSNFSALCNSARKDGHVFDEAAINKMFSAGYAAKSKEIMDSVIALVKASPKQPTLSNMGQTFAASDANNPNRVPGQKPGQSDDDAVKELIHKHCPGVQFSDKDFKIGDIFEAAQAAAG